MDFDDSLDSKHLERSARGLASAKRNKLVATPYTPPVLCAESRKAEAIIAAVGIRLLGLVQNEFERDRCRRRVRQSYGCASHGPIPGRTEQGVGNSPAQLSMTGNKSNIEY